jgi:hypothetical protein
MLTGDNFYDAIILYPRAKGKGVEGAGCSDQQTKEFKTDL